MSNTIQFNNKEYHRIAAKRDVEAVSQIRYGFFYLQWDVLIDGAYYQFVNSKPINGVYNLVGTNITIPESAITKTVYEGMEVSVNIPNSTQQSIGTLHINSHYFNYGCSKSTVEQSSACSLKQPSANYTARRLVREEDIIKPDTVKLYFDENYINVECFIKFGVPNYSIVTGTYDEYITRSINDDLSVDVQRSKNSQSYITCHVGDTIKIISTKTPLQNVAIRPYAEQDGNYPIIAPVDENGKVNTIDLQKDKSFDYIITSDCFITFDIATANYMLYGAILEDTEYCESCVVQVDNSDFIIAGNTEQAKRTIQENSKVNINTTLSLYTIEAYTKKRDAVFAGEPEYVLVDINNNVIYDTNGSEVYVDTEYNGDSLLTNAQQQIILSDSTSLPLAVQGWYNLIEVINLTTNEYVTVTTTGSSHSSNYSAYFTMPSADCLLTVNTKIVTDGDTVTISPLYSLTIEVDENSNSVFPISVTTGNTTTEYNSSTTIQNIENNYFSTTWNEVDGKLYHIQYKSNHTTFDDYTTKTASYSNSLMGNRTLSISLIDPDILYRNTTEISTITAGKEYEENNNIISNSNTIMGLNDQPRRTYYANTESSIKTSGNHFTNLQNLKKVVFNNADTAFTVNEDAFYECNKLESVSINGTENIKVKDRAFYNAIMLNEFADLNKITELGHSCFYGVGLEEYTANTELRVIPELAFSESLLSTANLAGTSINPSMLSTINNRAFKNCQKLTNVHLPYALSTLGQSVFENTAIPCVHTKPSYTNETIFSPYGVVFNADSEYKNGLTTLPSNTFEFCKYLEEVHLPVSITHIEKCAFRECDNLKHFASPGLKTIAQGAFKDTWIEGIKADGLVEIFPPGQHYGSLYKKSNTSGILFDVCGTNLGGLKQGFTLGTYIQPNPVYEGLILYKCNSIHLGSQSDSIYCIHPNTYHVAAESFLGTGKGYPFAQVGWYDDTTQPLITVGNSSFSRNNNLSTFTLPSNGSLILGKESFSYCDNLTTIFTRQCSVSSVPERAFAYCKSLIPPNFVDLKVKDIDDYAFDGSIRYAFDKYNTLCWIQNIVLLVSSVVYTFVSQYKMDMMLKADLEVDQDQYEYADEVKNTYSDRHYTDPERYGERYSGYATREDAENALSKILDGQNTDLQDAISSNGINNPSKYDNFKVGDKVYTQIYSGDGDPRVYFNGSSYAITGIPIYYIRNIAGRTLKKAIRKVLKQILPKIVDFVEKIQPYVSGVLSVLNFVEVLKKMRQAVWQAYGYPVEYDVSIPSYGQAVQSGVGLYSNRGVYDVIFPETLTSIGKYAFRNCKDLKSVGFLNCPCIIQEGSFYGCEFLSNVKVYQEIEQDGEQGLEENIYGYDIDSIGKYAFYQCDLFTNNINQLIENASVVEEYAFAKNKRMSVKYEFQPDVNVLSNASYNQLLVIPECLTTIGAHAFSGANFIQFTSNSPQDLNIDSAAFDPIHDDSYNEYLGAMSRVFVVPQEYVNQYKQRFEELNLSYDYMVTYSNDDNRLLEFV